MNTIINQLSNLYKLAVDETQKKYSFENNRIAIFNSISKSFLLKQAVLSEDLNNNSFSPADVKRKYNELFKSAKDINFSLTAIHYRSPNFKDNSGRLSVINSKRYNKDISNFHEYFLKLYFDIYGRINTFNERVFEIFTTNDFQSHRFDVIFDSNNEALLLSRDNLTQIHISENLSKKLIDDDSIDTMLNQINKESIDFFGWYEFLKLSKKINELEFKIDKVLYEVLSSENTFVNWKSLLCFLDGTDEKDLKFIDWERGTRKHLKKALEFLQGISLYRYFAKHKICTLIGKNENSNDILSFSFGYDEKNNDNDSFIDILLPAIKEFKKDIIQDPYHQKTHIGNVSNSETVFGKEIFDKIDILNCNQKILFNKCAQLIESLKGLAFAVHEGDNLLFNIYIGKQTSLSRFEELYDFTIEDVNKVRNNLPVFLKAHYSIFQNNLQGLFFDINNEDQVSLVIPLELIPSLSINQESFSYTNTISFKSSDYFHKQLTYNDKELIILQVGERNMKIYFNGSIFLSWPNKDTFGWTLSSTGEWNNKVNLINLFNQCFNSCANRDVAFINFLIGNLSETIMRISEERGKGGIVVMAACSDEKINGMKVIMNPNKFSYWKEKKINEFDTEELYNMMIPDGATILKIDSLKMENQIQLVPIEHCKAIDLNSISTSGTKGTRHNTAKAITRAINCIAICISADGPITVFYKGNELGISLINNIDLNNEH